MHRAIIQAQSFRNFFHVFVLFCAIKSTSSNIVTQMKKVTRIVSIFVISMLCFQEHIHVSSSPFLYARQVYEESSGGRNLKQEQEQEQKHAQEVRCSRERSRAARKVIEEYLTPFMERENYQLSSKCRLHPENDIFTDQEEHKIYIDQHEWRCGYCKKSFREEKFLDQHFDSRHYNFLNLSHGKCLADLCGALHCDAVMNFKSSRSKCNPAAAARNRHLCENLADNCFSISEGPSAGRLHELFLHQFCDAHTCSGKHKPFSRGGKDQSSFFRLAAGALILVLLPVFYLFLYLVQSDVKSRTQELRRISKARANKRLVGDELKRLLFGLEHNYTSFGSHLNSQWCF